MKKYNSRFMEINLEDIVLLSNVRKEFNEEAMYYLTQSIDTCGLLEPLVVVKKDNQYILAAGYRRYRAVTNLGWKKAECIIKEKPSSFQDIDDYIMQVHIDENEKREDLSSYELGLKLNEMRINGLSFKTIAKIRNLPESRVIDAIKAVKNTPKEVQEELTSMAPLDVTLSKVKPGQLYIKHAKIIANWVNHKKRYGIDTEEKAKKLYAFAKKSPQEFDLNSIKYRECVAKGLDLKKINAIISEIHEENVSKYIEVSLSFKELERVNKKYIKPGLFKNFNDVCKAILAGELDEKLKVESYGKRKQRVLLTKTALDSLST
ncbi:MAG: ParB/RepB/Spo0J family partition protein [Nanoarchaeota archaeon]